jgi:hypothetical protein
MMAVCLLFAFGPLHFSQAPETERQYLLCADQVRAFLLRDSYPKTLKAELHDWKKAPPYQTVSAAEYLLPYVLEEKQLKTPEYRWREGTHDLDQVSGRAAWALDELLGIKLTRIVPGSTRNDQGQVYREAERAVQASYAWVVKFADDGKNEERVRTLKARYAGKIKPWNTGFNAPKHSRAMLEFLVEWCPLGKKLTDLQEIIGTPAKSVTDLHEIIRGASGRKREEGHSYYFDTGRGGLRFLFQTKDGLIRAVYIVGLE